MPSFFSSILLNVRNLFNKEKTWFWLFGVSVFITSQIRYLTHSEFWSIFYSKFLFQPGEFQTSLYSKLIFQCSLFWIHWLPLGNLAHLVVARLVFGLVAAGILYFTYKILLLRVPWKMAMLIVTFLYVNPIVFWELPQAKADVLCLLLLLISLYSGLIRKRNLSLLFFSLALLTTPKSILFIPICAGLLFIADAKIFTWTNNTTLWIIRLGVCFAALLHFKPALLTTYRMAWSLFKYFINEGLTKGFYNYGNTYFIELFLTYMLPGLVLIFVGYKYGLRKNLVSQKQKKLFWFTILWSFFALTIYPLKHPYFLINFVFLLPLVFIFSTEKDFVVQFQNLHLVMRKKKYLVAIFILALLGTFHSFLYNWGANQIRTVVKLDRWLGANNQIRIADGTGVLPRANNLPQFLEFFESEANKHFLRSVLTDHPDLIFVTAKVFSHFGQVSNLFEVEYVYVSRFILARKIEMSAKDLESGEKILSGVKQQFKFEPKVISFRAHARLAKNRPLKATCQDTSISKMEWTPSELISCKTLTYKFLDWDAKNNKPEVYPVPFESETDPLLAYLPEQTNFKDFNLLVNLITDFEQLMRMGYGKNK